MRQRVALARALAQRTPVLLMDEPFASLDAITRDVLHDELTRVWRDTGVSVVFVTHNVREAVTLGQRILLMSSRPGRIIRTWDVAGTLGPEEADRRPESPPVAALAADITGRLREEIRRHAA
jgi:NitT/TauT family transport system ATP-binding protein